MSRFFWLDDLDSDLREYVLFSLRALWTQASNALEGNTFTKGDTLFFLREGLTVSGKTLQEHLDIKAIPMQSSAWRKWPPPALPSASRSFSSCTASSRRP